MTSNTYCDCLIHNVHIASMHNDSQLDYGEIHNAAVAIKEGKVLWVGPTLDASRFTTEFYIDGKNGWLTPGLIDSHTHLIYGGNRAREFEWRLQGEDYQQISKRGGGIVSTVKDTRNASDQQLFSSALKRLTRLMSEGVTTVEIKSGYGLDTATELRMLRTARALAAHTGITIKTTFLGAHAIPPEYNNDADSYLDLVINEMLPQVVKHDLADAVDVFCEGIGFTPKQTRRLFTAASKLGLPVKGHFEQLSDLKGALLATEFGALSVDHLEYLSPCDLPAIKASNTVANLLPGAFYCLSEKQRPPVQQLLAMDIPVAVATDLNPGTSPIASLLLAMNQSCILFGLTPAQALAGTTRHAAQALGLQSNKGQIRKGFDADLLLWEIDHPSELSYAINMHKPTNIWVNGLQHQGVAL